MYTVYWRTIQKKTCVFFPCLNAFLLKPPLPRRKVSSSPEVPVVLPQGRKNPRHPWGPRSVRFSRERIDRSLLMFGYGCFLKMVGFSPQIIYFNRRLYYKLHPFWGSPIFENTHIEEVWCVSLKWWGFPPKSSILIGGYIINSIHFGVALFLKTPI